MCGRFTLSHVPDPFAEIFKLEEPLEAPPEPHYNIAPTQAVSTVISDRGKRRLTSMRWGLVPSWSDGPGHGAPLINARCETIGEKPSFQESFEKRRCLVPADGYYEWIRTEGYAQPYHIHLRGMSMFAFAAIWDTWSGPDGRLDSLAIVTTESNSLTSHIHDRMPVILDEAGRDAWLAEGPPAPTLDRLFDPFDSELMAFDPVGQLVNSVANDSKDCLKPVPTEGPPQLGLF